MESNICAVYPSYSIHMFTTFHFHWFVILHLAVGSLILWQIVFPLEPKCCASSVHQFMLLKKITFLLHQTPISDCCLGK